MTTKNELILINNIVYQIYTIPDLTDMRMAFLTSLKLLIDSDISTFELAAEGTPPRVADPVGIGINKQDMQQYVDEVQDYDYGKWVFSASSGRSYRETDFADETARIQTPYYQNYFRKIGMHYCGVLSVIKNQIFYGCVTLFRSKDKPDFSDRDLFMLDLMQDHLGYRLETDKNLSAQRHPGTAFSAQNKTVYSVPTVESLIKDFGLTLRESEIISLLLNGIRHDDICEQLCITPNTLKKHISNIYRKTGVHSWRELSGRLVK